MTRPFQSQWALDLSASTQFERMFSTTIEINFSLLHRNIYVVIIRDANKLVQVDKKSTNLVPTGDGNVVMVILPCATITWSAWQSTSRLGETIRTRKQFLLTLIQRMAIPLSQGRLHSKFATYAYVLYVHTSRSPILIIFWDCIKGKTTTCEGTLLWYNVIKNFLPPREKVLSRRNTMIKSAVS